MIMLINVLLKKNNNRIVLENDNLEQLKLNIIKKLSEIELEMNYIRNQDIELEQILKDKKILDDKIEISYINNEEKGLVLKIIR